VLCRLYITVGKSEEAVSMYKQLKMYGDMVRLVKQYFPEHLDATHLQLAKVAHSLLDSLHYHYHTHTCTQFLFNWLACVKLIQVRPCSQKANLLQLLQQFVYRPVDLLRDNIAPF